MDVGSGSGAVGRGQLVVVRADGGGFGAAGGGGNRDAGYSGHLAGLVEAVGVVEAARLDAAHLIALVVAAAQGQVAQAGASHRAEGEILGE